MRRKSRFVWLALATTVALTSASASAPIVAASVEGGGASAVSMTCRPDSRRASGLGDATLRSGLRSALIALDDGGGLGIDVSMALAAPATVVAGDTVQATIAIDDPFAAMLTSIADQIVPGVLPAGATVRQLNLIVGDRYPGATVAVPVPTEATLVPGSASVTGTQTVGEPGLAVEEAPNLVSVEVQDHDAVGLNISHPDPSRTGYILNATSPQWTALTTMDLATDELAEPGTNIEVLPPHVLANVDIHLVIDDGGTVKAVRMDSDWLCTATAAYLPVGDIAVQPPSAGLAVRVDAERDHLLAGQPIRWNIEVLNTGATALASIVLSDAIEPGCAAEVATLAPGTSTTIACQTETIGRQGPLVHSVVATAGGTTATASTSVEIVGCAPPGPFSDVTDAHRFCPQIEWAAAAGLTTGYADGTFRPTTPITRQALVAMLYRSAGSPAGDPPTCDSPPFPDVAVASPFCGEIEWATSTGLTTGYADGTFGPTRSISRQALAVILRGPRLPVDRPNLVVIQTDDQTIDGLAVMPRTQRLLGGVGVSFEQAVSPYPLCCPARASLLTGQFSHNNGVQYNKPPTGGYQSFTGQDTAMPVALQAAGYRTAHIGKYLNGYGIDDPTEVPPGWNVWQTLVDPTTYKYYRYSLNSDGAVTEPPAWDYQTDHLFDLATEEISTATALGEPFFLALDVLAPHVDTLSGDEAVAIYGRPLHSAIPAARHIGREGTEPLPADPAIDVVGPGFPAFVTARPPIGADGLQDLTVTYRAELESLLSVDEGIERLVEVLDDAGALDDTVIVFLSDNGFLHGQHRVVQAKYHPWEPSVRIPLLIRGPGIWRGATSSVAVSTVDVTATLLDLADAEPLREQDGRSLVPLLLDPGLDWHRTVLIASGPNADGLAEWAGLRNDRWKYVEWGATPFVELHDLAADPFELVNLAEEPAYAAIRSDFAAMLAVRRDCAGSACG